VLKIIVAMARNRVIGLNNQMPWHIPEDLAYFKKLTFGGTVIMGSNTYRSIGKALPGRTNIVLSRSKSLQLSDARLYDSFKDAIRDFPDAFVIGGAQLFAQALPLAGKLYITHIDLDIPGDTMFPEIQWGDWQRISCESAWGANGRYPLNFCVYQRLTS
jgi:dihydrofolate reductase